jgi:hypothetical protein
MKQSGKTFEGNLAFFNNWELFWSSGKTGHCPIYMSTTITHSWTVTACL